MHRLSVLGPSHPTAVNARSCARMRGQKGTRIALWHHSVIPEMIQLLMEATMYQDGHVDAGTERYTGLHLFRCRARRAKAGIAVQPARRNLRRGGMHFVTILAMTMLSACDSPTDPTSRNPSEQELVTLAYTMGLSSAAINTNHVLNINGTLYDVGCPMQCWLPEGIVTLLEQMVANGTIFILWTSPPSVFVPATKTPIYLQNGRSVPICSNGIDDDGDGLTDWPSDPGCESPADNNEFNTVVILETSTPILTAPTFIHGNIPFKGMKQWSLTCPLRGTLASTDHRTWTAVGLVLEIQYVKFTPGSGWVVTDTDTISLAGDATAGNAALGTGWSHTLRLSNHEARIRFSVLVRGDDGEEILVPANDGAQIFCGL